jgi:hypothetical protein
VTDTYMHVSVNSHGAFSEGVDKVTLFAVSFSSQAY